MVISNGMNASLVATYVQTPFGETIEAMVSVSLINHACPEDVTIMATYVSELLEEVTPRISWEAHISVMSTTTRCQEVGNSIGK